MSGVLFGQLDLVLELFGPGDVENLCEKVGDLAMLVVDPAQVDPRPYDLAVRTEVNACRRRPCRPLAWSTWRSSWWQPRGRRGV